MTAKPAGPERRAEQTGITRKRDNVDEIDPLLLLPRIFPRHDDDSWFMPITVVPTTARIIPEIRNLELQAYGPMPQLLGYGTGPRIETSLFLCCLPRCWSVGYGHQLPSESRKTGHPTLAHQWCKQYRILKTKTRTKVIKQRHLADLNFNLTPLLISTVVMLQIQNRGTINGTWKVAVSFKIIMTKSVRPCFTIQHQTCMTTTEFFGLRPVLSEDRRSQTTLPLPITLPKCLPIFKILSPSDSAVNL